MILKTKSTNPETLRKEVVELLTKKKSPREASNFNQMCHQSVNLNTKNTKNYPNSKDLACLQVCDLAKMYGVEVVRE